MCGDRFCGVEEDDVVASLSGLIGVSSMASSVTVKVGIVCPGKLRQSSLDNMEESGQIESLILVVNRSTAEMIERSEVWSIVRTWRASELLLRL